MLKNTLKFLKTAQQIKSIRNKKGSRGTEFSNYVNRIKFLFNFDTFEKFPAEYKDVSGFTVKQGKRVKTTVKKQIFLN